MNGLYGEPVVHLTQCGCRIVVAPGRPPVIHYCLSHTLAYDCGIEFKRVAPAAFRAWWEACEAKMRQLGKFKQVLEAKWVPHEDFERLLQRIARQRLEIDEARRAAKASVDLPSVLKNERERCAAAVEGWRLDFPYKVVLEIAKRLRDLS